MARSTRLTDEDRDFLRFILASLNLTQKVFAEHAGVPQGWLSGVMSGKRPGVEQAMLERMGIAAQRLLGEAEQDGSVVESDAEALRKGIGQVFRMRQETQKLLAPPGGAIPTDAANFIDRPGEMEIALDLLKGTSFTMSVEGGPMSGKTTFLRWFEEEAEKRGFEVAYLDCGDFPLRDFEGDELEQRFNSIILYIAEYLIEAWSLPPVKTDGMQFMNWWMRMKGPLGTGRPRPRLLILDRLTRLDLKLSEYLLKLIRNTHNSRGNDRVALSFALGVDADIVNIKNDVRRSHAYSVVQPRLWMRRFDERQIREMLQAVCGGGFREEWVGRVETLVNVHDCQPYFVHAAANFLQDHPDINILEREVKSYFLQEGRKALGALEGDAREEELLGQLDAVRQMELYIESCKPEDQDQAAEFDRIRDRVAA